MSARLKIDFLGALAADMVRGKHTDGSLRRVTKVEIMAEGTPPSGTALVFKLRVATVENSQEFTLAAGETYVSTAVTGDGLEVAANAALDVICKTPASAIDVTVWLTVATVSAAGIADTDLNLGTLAELKSFLLTEGQVGETTYDVALAHIGRGVAGQFDRYCNRIFRRSTSATDTFRADLDHVILRRYPVESVTAVSLQTDPDTGYVAQSGAILNWSAATGVVRFGAALGTIDDLIRVSYAGGYWYDTTSDGSGTLPAGATLLPYEIKDAWLIQCQHIWAKRDNLGLQHAVKPEERTTLTNLALVPAVKAVLESHRRFAVL